MRVYGIWYGGINYVQSDMSYLEVFASIGAVSEALKDRAGGHHFPSHFEYVNREPVSTLTPCADDGAYVDVFLVDPTHAADEYDFMADRRYELTERGAVLRTF